MDPELHAFIQNVPDPGAAAGLEQAFGANGCVTPQGLRRVRIAMFQFVMKLRPYLRAGKTPPLLASTFGTPL